LADFAAFFSVEATLLAAFPILRPAFFALVSTFFSIAMMFSFRE
jgi:hypothetical protein